MVMVGLATALAVAGSTMVENNFFDIFGGTMFNVIFFTTIIATFILSFLITLKVLINKEY
jgi:uncharacterized membrane protein